MAWSFAFLAAGCVNARMSHRAWPLGIRRGVYLGVLWGWALLAWWVVLQGNLR